MALILSMDFKLYEDAPHGVGLAISSVSTGIFLPQHRENWHCTSYIIGYDQLSGKLIVRVYSTQQSKIF